MELPDLSTQELSRYSRHITLPQIGLEGQKKLKAAKVLIIGAGGLGAPVALYLAAAGVGTIGLVDADVVDESNLQRQVLYSVEDIGKAKAMCAQAKLLALNPHIAVDIYNENLSSANAMQIIAKYDIVIDGTDNFPTRYLVNDACILLGKPNAYGSIFRFDGQASVFNYRGGPCYRCVYSEPPPAGLVPSCAEGGVLGILPAIIGSIQATETIKMITETGTTLSGRFLLFDALAMEFRELKITRNSDCPVCGKNPTITQLIDYQQYCQTAPPKIAEISCQQLKQRLDTGEKITILDVREPYEREIASIAGTLHIPQGDVERRLAELDPQREIIVHCKGGGRSAKVCELLKQKGFRSPINLRGGILAWAREIDPSMRTY